MINKDFTSMVYGAYFFAVDKLREAEFEADATGGLPYARKYEADCRERVEILTRLVLDMEWNDPNHYSNREG